MVSLYEKIIIELPNNRGGETMLDKNERIKTCCFTGHRPEKLSVPEEKVKKLLRKEIIQAVSDGFTIFITGMAKGVDIWAAQIVLEQKKKNQDIKLICAVPFRSFSAYWNKEWRTAYEYIIKNADDVKYICEKYGMWVFQARNCWMVDHSFRIIAAFSGEKGGTKNTIDYAERHNIEIRNIFDTICSTDN